MPPETKMDSRSGDPFLALSPMERMERMHRHLLEVISLRARAEGLTEHEVYLRYLRDNPRHYERTPRED